MRRLLAPALLTLALALTACGDGGTVSGSPTTAPPTTAPPTTPAPTATASPTPSGGPGCPIQTSPAPGTNVVTAHVKNKDIEAPSRSISVKLGTRVRLAITTDVADEVHVHTYDLREEVATGCTSAIEFTANIPGTVEVELERSHVHVLEIKAS